MKQPKVGALVYVEWEDSHHRTGWNEEGMDGLPVPCRSVGWVVAVTESGIALAANVTGEQRCGEMTIPMRSVQKIKELKV